MRRALSGSQAARGVGRALSGSPGARRGASATVSRLPGRRTSSVLKPADVPDLAACGAAEVGRDVHFLAGGLDVPRVAERAGFRRESHFSRLCDHGQSETLHPILQKIRRRRIVTSIGMQSNLRRVRDAIGVTGVNANEGALERRGERRRPLAAGGDGDGRL